LLTNLIAERLRRTAGCVSRSRRGPLTLFSVVFQPASGRYYRSL